MSNYKDLNKFEQAAVRIVRLQNGSDLYTDEEYYDSCINGYHCEDEMRKEVEKLETLAQRINIAKEFGLI